MGTKELIDIEKELCLLRDHQLGQNKIRSSLFNLIITSKKKPHLQELQALADSVISLFPCRILFVIQDPTGEDFMKTSVEAASPKNTKVYCEQIKIELAGSYCERAYYLILPHLLCDLPVYMLWTDELSCDDLFLKKLAPYVDRLIIDSDQIFDLDSYSNSVLELMKKRDCNFGDLNWSALSGWRSLIDEFFLPPEMSNLLLEPKSLEITYEKGNDQNAVIEALFLTCWFTDSLGWSCESFEIFEGAMYIGFHFNKFSPKIILKAMNEENLPTKSLLSVEYESLINQSKVIFKRHPKTRQVCTQFSDKNRCDLPFYHFLPGSEEGLEIIEEIFHPSQQRPYVQMLKMLQKITQRSKHATDDK